MHDPTTEPRDPVESGVAGSALTPLVAYAPRHFRFEGLIEFPGISVKLYTIGGKRDPLDRRLVQGATEFARRHMVAEVERLGDHYGLGFLILHAGQQANWLLCHWWAHGDIGCQIMANTTEDAPEIFAMCESPYHACVWEGVAIHHEHKAWIASMLNGAPNPEAYLADSLVDGAY